MSQDPVPPDDRTYRVRGRRRSAPRYRAFVGTGVVLGIVAALVWTATTTPDPDATESFALDNVAGYTGLLLGFVGGLLGAGVAVLLDRRSR